MTNSKTTVVLVHGLGGNRFDMLPMARDLRRHDFSTLNWCYRSIGKRIETHAQQLTLTLQQLDEARQPFHLVTHSMGGIITRMVLAQQSFYSLRRIVMLAPPHQGSHAARKLVPWIGWLTPSLKQLSDESTSFVNQLPNPFENQNFDLAIVEAKKDRVIAPGKVLLDGYRDFAMVEGHHGILPWYKDTIKLVRNFLIYGQFDSSNQFTKSKHAPHAEPATSFQAAKS